MNNYIEAAKKVIEIEKQALDRISNNLGDGFVSSIEVVLECLNNKGKIVVVGVGKSGNIGHKVAATLNSAGATAVVLNSQNALHGDLGLISDGDVILAMSHSGETAELISLIPFIKRMGVKIIGLTSKPKSSLGRYSDHVLDSSIEREACPLNLAPTSSSTAMLVLGDALAMVLLEARGITKEDFARFHPSGSLGKILLTQVKEVMRTNDYIAKIQKDESILEALKEMSLKKSGSCIAMDGDVMAGIMTHGDFVRCYTADNFIGEKKVQEVMSAEPITIHQDSLAAEAINIFQNNNIDDLIVVNDENYPVGLIDSQDLAKHKII